MRPLPFAAGHRRDQDRLLPDLLRLQGLSRAWCRPSSGALAAGAMGRAGRPLRRVPAAPDRPAVHGVRIDVPALRRRLQPGMCEAPSLLLLGMRMDGARSEARVSPSTAHGERGAALDLLDGRTDVDLLFADLIMPGGMNGVVRARGEAADHRPCGKSDRAAGGRTDRPASATTTRSCASSAGATCATTRRRATGRTNPGKRLAHRPRSDRSAMQNGNIDQEISRPAC